jgi:hypothetical protein
MAKDQLLRWNLPSSILAWSPALMVMRRGFTSSAFGRRRESTGELARSGLVLKEILQDAVHYHPHVVHFAIWIPTRQVRHFSPPVFFHHYFVFLLPVVPAFTFAA